MDNMKIAHVYWVDAGMKMGWQIEAAALAWADDVANFMVSTVGFVVEETDEYLVLVQGVTSDSDDNVLNPVRIQKGNIIGIQELKPYDRKEAEFD